MNTYILIVVISVMAMINHNDNKNCNDNYNSIIITSFLLIYYLTFLK